MLKLDLRPGQSVQIGGAVVTLESKSGQVARLSIEADKSVAISRVQHGTSAAKIAAISGIAVPA